MQLEKVSWRVTAATMQGDYANVSSHLTASDSHHSPGIGGVGEATPYALSKVAVLLRA